MDGSRLWTGGEGAVSCLEAFRRVSVGQLDMHHPNCVFPRGKLVAVYSVCVGVCVGGHRMCENVFGSNAF